jgi:hypothetical protein
VTCGTSGGECGASLGLPPTIVGVVGCGATGWTVGVGEPWLNGSGAPPPDWKTFRELMDQYASLNADGLF